jgi:ribose-phosphate pyrophosphokinase
MFAGFPASRCPRTIESATRALLAAGAREVNAVFIHAIMAPGALQRLSNAGITRIMTTDSVPMAQNDRVEVISVAPILARALQQHAYL